MTEIEIIKTTHLMLKCDYHTTLQRKKEQIKYGRETEDHNWLK